MRFSKAFKTVERQKDELAIANKAYQDENEERRRVEQALIESEKRYRLLAENVTDSIWVVDLHRPIGGDAKQPEGPHGNVLISVEDTGIGIGAKDLERIFKPFEQTDHPSNKTLPGTGLGLTLTRKLVELHGGKIWAESPGEDRGSRFNFVIPFPQKQSE